MRVNPERIALAVLAGLSLLAWGGGRSAAAELCAPFAPFYALAFLGLLLPALRRRLPHRRAWAGLAALGVLANGLPVAQQWLPAADPGLQLPQGLRVAFANAQGRRHSAPRLLEWLHDCRPDLAALAEVGPHYEALLADLARELPFSHEIYRTDNYGLAVFSRWPLEDVRELSLDGEVPTLSAWLLLPRGRIRLVVTHVPPPNVEPGRHAQQMRALEELIGEPSEALLLLGDLNSTPWSPRFRALRRATGLRSARQGFGWLPSWGPRRLPFRLLPIDHVLLHGPWRVTRFATGPAIRSDHLPILAELEIESGAPADVAAGAGS